MKTERFKQICHFAAGSLLLPVAFKMFAHKHFTLCVVVLMFGILFLFFSAILEGLERVLGSNAKLVFLLESLVFASIVFYFIEQGNKKLTLSFLGLSVLYFLLFINYLYFNKHRKKKHSRKHRHRSSSNKSLGKES
ncbi:MAG: hypothetical protein AMXMBFR79_11960 [Chitinophagaceae bacterium]|nr:hypothetical protein [Chitinophagaceae bacterium]MCZ2298351.1 hypothetical protein [Chitinophagales bacterium]